MKIGLIDVDNQKKVKYPNLALMKLAAWHRAQGDTVEWWWGFEQYDRVYMSRVFDDIYTKDVNPPANTKEIIKGGSGYVLRDQEGVLKINRGRGWEEAPADGLRFGDTEYVELLPYEIEHTCPDYSLYTTLKQDTAYGFLTRGCPKACEFCIVAGKEGRRSIKTADLNEWWSGQKKIVLMDPNLLAYRGHMELLEQLIESKAWVDVNQGFDARLVNERNIEAINRMKLKEIHFAWDFMKETKRVLRGLELYKQLATRKPHGKYATVYTLTNFNTTMEENLYRIYTLRDMGYDPYVMVYDKPNAPQEIRRLQRWCNNRKIFTTCPQFEDYKG